MTYIPPKINHWLQVRGAFLFPFLAFLIPLAVRFIPEILMGQYLVGFDPLGYYVPNTISWLQNGVNFWLALSASPLLYLMLMGTTYVGASITVVLKILGPILLGALGLAIYIYANKALAWSAKKSLLTAVLSTLYFVALRTSWDMFRVELALVFLFLSLILLQSPLANKTRNQVLLASLMLLVVFSHQLIAVIMFAIVLATLLRWFVRKNKTEILRTLFSLTPAFFGFLLIFYINFFVYSSPILGYSINYSGGINSLADASHIELLMHNLGFLALCYVPLVPLILFSLRGFRGDFQLKAWILWIMFPIILMVLSPSAFFLGGVLPYRWVLLLTYPLTFFAVEGISRIRWRWYKAPAGLALGLVLVVLSAGFMALPNNDALSYFGAYPNYIPKSMLQNTVQLSDCQDTANALFWAQNHLPNNSHLLVHEVFYGWAMLTFDNDRLVPYFFGNLTEITPGLKNNTSTGSLYLIWWVNGAGWYGQPYVPSEFSEAYVSGNIAIYRYSAAS